MVKGNTREKGRPRRTDGGVRGFLLLGRNLLLVLVALLLLAGGVWTSWSTAQHAMLTKGRERGTMTLSRCTEETCTGTFVPADAEGPMRPEVSIARAVAQEEGEKLAVAVKPGTEEVVRTGLTGVLYAWVPLAGAFLLAALIVAGGLRLRRTAWALGLAGGLLLGASFATL